MHGLSGGGNKAANLVFGDLQLPINGGVCEQGCSLKCFSSIDIQKKALNLNCLLSAIVVCHDDSRSVSLQDAPLVNAGKWRILKPGEGKK
jgi:hypothetical protein